MKICDYIKTQYDAYEATPIERRPILIKDCEVGSWEYFKTFCDYVCAGGYDYEFKKVGITQEQLDNAVKNKFMKLREYSNWEARQLGRTKLYLLTNKGMKAMYKAYEW